MFELVELKQKDINRGTAAVGTNIGSISANDDNFICWVTISSSGFFGGFYFEYPTYSTTNVWCSALVGSSVTLSDAKFVKCYYLAYKS